MVKFRYCADCGCQGSYEIPEGDNRERFVCSACEKIHYQNPLIVVGTIPLWVENGEPKVLLCKRAIEPRLGYWTLPAGFMELGETLEQGAIRETYEESKVSLESAELYRLYSTVDRAQVHIYFRAPMPSASFSVTTESSEVKLVSFDKIPWRHLAFPSVYRALKDFVNEYPAKNYTVETVHIEAADWARLSQE